MQNGGELAEHSSLVQLGGYSFHYSDKKTKKLCVRGLQVLSTPYVASDENRCIQRGMVVATNI